MIHFKMLQDSKPVYIFYRFEYSCFCGATCRVLPNTTLPYNVVCRFCPLTRWDSGPSLFMGAHPLGKLVQMRHSHTNASLHLGQAKLRRFALAFGQLKIVHAAIFRETVSWASRFALHNCTKLEILSDIFIIRPKPFPSKLNHSNSQVHLIADSLQTKTDRPIDRPTWTNMRWRAN